MKYGLMYGYFHEDWEGDYLPEMKRVSRIGFDAMEIHTNKLLTMTDKELDELKAGIEENDLLLIYDICLGRETDISCDDKAIQKNGIQYATSLLKQIHKLDGHNVAGINYVGWNCFDAMIDKPKRIDNSVACMKEIIKVAEDLDIVYGFEVTNRFEQFMLNTAQEGVDYAKRVDSPYARVQLDINHMLIEEDDIHDAIVTAGSLLSHLHVAESNRRVPMGGGFVPWQDLARGLKEIGYDRTITLEPLSKLGGSVARDAKMWRQAIPDVSDEALERDITIGLRFIRSVMEA